MAAVLVGMVLSREGYRRFVTARADGRYGIAPFAVYFLCGTVGLWVLGTIVYFGLTRQ